MNIVGKFVNDKDNVVSESIDGFVMLRKDSIMRVPGT